MAINRNHPLIKRGLDNARKVATATSAPMFDMVELFALAFADPKSKLGDATLSDFRDLVQEIRVQAKHPTLAENRISETWSCVELGAFKCAPELFKNIRKLPNLPGLSALYDITCSMRRKGPFADKGMHAGKGLGSKGWDSKAAPVRADAPTVAQLADALQLGNAARNKNKVQQVQSFDDVVTAMVARLEKYRDGFEQKSNGKTVKHPPVKSAALLEAIAALGKIKLGNGAAKNGKSNVVPMRKRAA